MKTLNWKARNVLKQRILDLAQEQFGELLKTVRFSGPFEDEDLDADIILRKRMELKEIGAKLSKIYHPLEEEGYHVLIEHEFDERSNVKRKT